MFFSASKIVIFKPSHSTCSLFHMMPLRFLVEVTLEYLNDFKKAALINN
jgi:hypothetical protein